jgi:hypothetical protein
VLDVNAGAPAGRRAFCLLRHIDNRPVACADGKLFPLLDAATRCGWSTPIPVACRPNSSGNSRDGRYTRASSGARDHRVRYGQDPVSWRFWQPSSVRGLFRTRTLRCSWSGVTGPKSKQRTTSKGTGGDVLHEYQAPRLRGPCARACTHHPSHFSLCESAFRVCRGPAPGFTVRRIE